MGSKSLAIGFHTLLVKVSGEFVRPRKRSLSAFIMAAVSGLPLEVNVLISGEAKSPENGGNV